MFRNYTWLYSFLSLFIVSSAMAQSNDSVVAKIRDYYNAAQYDRLYSMLSTEFKAGLTEKDFTAFYKNELKLSFGNIKGYQLATTRKAMSRYLVGFEHGSVNLIFELNALNQIAMLQWLPVAAPAQARRDPKSIGSNNPKSTKLQKLVDSLALGHLVKSENCGLAIGILHKGKTELYYYGQTNKEKGPIPNDNTRFEIGSLTKTFTGLLLAKAVEQGKLKLDDDIRNYLPASYPNLDYKGQPIRIVQLSNHTSGLPRLPDNLEAQPGFDINDPYKNYSKAMLLDYLHTLRPDTLPGTRMEYSNLGLGVLGLVLESVYKQDYETLIAKEILKPLGMSHTAFGTTATRAGMAQGYNEEGNPAAHWEFNSMNPAGGITATLPDMLRYAGAYTTHKFQGVALAQTPTFSNADDTVALNWFRRPSKGGHTIVWHNGGTGGFTSFCGLLEHAETAVVILNNSAQGVDGIAIELLSFLERAQQ